MGLKSSIAQEIARNRQRIEKLGPGLITGGAGDDPAGIATYTIVGATSGLSQLWLLLLSTPMMIAMQNAVARIAIVTGKSLPEITSTFFSKRLTIAMISLLALANILTIGADLNAVASVLGILSGYKPIYFLIPITALIGYLVLFGRYATIKRILIALTAVLGVYILSAIYAKPDILELLKATFIPHIQLEQAWIVAALGMLGTTISPYMLFWQASEEREEKRSVVQADEVRFDTIVGMVYSNLLAYCMIVSGAMMLHGITQTPDITQLALALKPAAGSLAFILFSLGIVVSGFLAIPVLAGSTAYAVADTFGWREGMDNKVSDAKGFYFVFVGALVIANVIDMIPTISVVDALYYSQVFDGLLIPLLIALTYTISNNQAIMGPFRSDSITNTLLILAFCITTGLGIVMVWQLWSGS